MISPMSRRSVWMLVGGGALGSLLLVNIPTQEHVTRPVTRAVDVEPVSFVQEGGSVRLEWDESLVMDLDVIAQISTFDPATRQDCEVMSISIRNLPPGSLELRGGSLLVASPARELANLAEGTPRVIVERLVATARVRGGSPEHSFMTQARRFYRVEGRELKAMSQKEFDAIVDPVYVHLGPDGRSYRFQRGPFEAAAMPKEPLEVAFDEQIEGVQRALETFNEELDFASDGVIDMIIPCVVGTTPGTNCDGLASAEDRDTFEQRGGCRARGLGGRPEHNAEGALRWMGPVPGWYGEPPTARAPRTTTELGSTSTCSRGQTGVPPSVRGRGAK